LKEEKKKPKRPYLDVNIPRDWKPYIDELKSNPEIKAKLEINGFTQTTSGLGAWKIKQFFIEHTDFRSTYINTKENKTTIYDIKLRRLTDIYLRPREKDVWCSLCDATECEHINFALRKIEAFRKTAQKLLNEGWNIPEV